MAPARGSGSPASTCCASQVHYMYDSGTSYLFCYLLFTCILYWDCLQYLHSININKKIVSVTVVSLSVDRFILLTDEKQSIAQSILALFHPTLVSFGVTYDSLLFLERD